MASPTYCAAQDGRCATYVTVPLSATPTVKTVVRTGTRIRFVHAIADGPAVNIWFDNIQQGSNVLIPKVYGVTYPEITSYLEVLPGNRIMDVRTADGNKSLYKAPVPVNLTSGGSYTVVVTGSATSKNQSMLPDFMLSSDTKVCPADDNAHIRFINAAAGSSTLDLYVGNELLFGGVPFNHVGMPEYKPAKSGVKAVTITEGVTNRTLLGPYNITLDSNGIYTFIAMGMSSLALSHVKDNKDGCVVLEDRS